MRSFLSFVGTIAATTVGLFALNSAGIRPDISGYVLLWAGFSFGFINYMVIEGWNAFKPTLAPITALKAAAGMSVAFGLLTALSFFSNQPPVGVDMFTAVTNSAAYIGAITLFSGVGFWFGGMFGEKFGAKND